MITYTLKRDERHPFPAEFTISWNGQPIGEVHTTRGNFAAVLVGTGRNAEGIDWVRRLRDGDVLATGADRLVAFLRRAGRLPPSQPDRIAALAALRAAYAAQGLDADAEVEGIDTMTADQLRDEVTYLSDHQG